MDCREKANMRNIPHAVVMREYGTSRCLNQLASEFRVTAEEHLVTKEYAELKCDLPHFTRSTYLMVFSPDGKKMASSHGNHNVYVTDVKTGRNLNTLSGHPRTPWCIAFHPSSNQILASGCLGGQVRVWDLHGGSEIWTIEGQTSIASLAFHPSDRLLVIASYNEIYFWDWSQPEPFAKCNTINEKEKVRYVAFDYTGSKLVTGIEIPKPLQSQWDRVGPGGQPNRSAGPLGPRPGGQRPGFGTVFSRSGQGLGSGPGSSTTSGPTSTPGTSSRSSSNTPPHSTSSYLEGRIRTNGQMLLMLLDPRRQTHRSQMIRRLITRYTNSMNNEDESRNITRERNPLNEQVASNSESPPVIPTSQADTSQGTWGFNPSRHQAHPSSSSTVRNDGDGSPNSSPFRNLTSPEILSTISSLVFNNSGNASDTSGSIQAPCSRSNFNDHVMDSSGASSQEQRVIFSNADLSSGVSNIEEPAVRSTRSANVSSQRASEPQRPSAVLVYNDLYMRTFSARLIQEIQRNISILFVQLSNMQYCTVCSPPMNSSQLCHIQQLWLELRDQIRPLQTSVLENINLTTTSWHRSASQSATDMIHQWARGLEYRPQHNNSTGSNTASQTNIPAASSSSQPNENPVLSPPCSSWRQHTNNLAPTNVPTEQPTSCSTSESCSKSNDSNPSSSVSQNILPTRTFTPTNNLGSIGARPNLRSGQRGTVHRLHRCSQMGKTLHLRCQSALGRRYGTTAGALRAQRYHTHARQVQTAGVQHTGTSERCSTNQLFAEGIHRPQRSSSSTLPEESTEAVNRSEESTQGTSHHPMSGRSWDTAVEDIANVNSSLSQLCEYRFLLGRRRNTTSRLSRNPAGRGSQRSHSQHVTPPRCCGGRRSVSEVAIDPPGVPSPSEQLASNSRTSNQSSVRTSESMLMRIIRSLRRAAFLSGRAERIPLHHDSELSEPADHRNHHHYHHEHHHHHHEHHHHEQVSAVPQSSPLEENNLLRDQAQDTSANQSNQNSEPLSMPPWTQNSEPEDDVSDNHDSQFEPIDPAVREGLTNIQPSSSMNMVQDGVMTEDLARNLLRLHLHQQHQELQLRQQQARLRVRLQNQSVPQAAGQPQRDLPRRLALCPLCGGSIYISSHIFLRVDTPSENPPSANVSTQTNTTSSASATSQTEASSTSSPCISTSSFSQSPLQRGHQRQSHACQEPTTHLTESSEHGQTQTSSSIHLYQPFVAQLLRSSAAPQSNEAREQVIPLLLEEASVLSPSPATLFPPSHTALPSCQLPTSPSLPPLPPRQRMQASSHRNGLDSEGHQAPSNPSFTQHLPSDNEIQHSNQRAGNKSPTPYHQECENQQTSSSPKVLTCVSNESEVSTGVGLPDSSTILDMPSTSSGIGVTGNSENTDKSHYDICSKLNQEGPVVGDSSSSDSETECIMRHLRKRRASHSSSVKGNDKYKARQKVDSQLLPNSSDTTEAGPSHHSGSKMDSATRQPMACKDENSIPQEGKGDSNETAAAVGPRSSTIGHSVSSRKQSTNASETAKEESNVSHAGVTQSSTNGPDPSNQTLPSFATQGVPLLNLLPDPTFTRQLEAVTFSLDNLMSLQRNALSNAQRNRNVPPETSPLRNPGSLFPGAQGVNSRKIDALTSANQSLHRLLETMSHQILMVQNFRSREGSCSEHNDSTPPPGLVNPGAQPNVSSFVSNVRRRGQELLRLMTETLSTFSSLSRLPVGLPEDFRRNPQINHMQSLSAAFWLLQGLYILIHVGLELSDLLLTYFISCYESNASEEIPAASLPQPCVCLNYNPSSTSPVPRPPVASTQLWSGQSISATARDLLPLMFESLRSQFRYPFSNSVNSTSDSSNESLSPSSISANRRPWLVNLHNVLASARLQQGHFRPHSVSELYFRSRQTQQNEGQPVVQIPVMSVPSHTPQVNSEATVEPPTQQPVPPTYALVHHPVVSTIRRNISQVPHTTTSQQLENNSQPQASIIPGYSRPGFMRLRSRLRHPPVQQQDQPSVSMDPEVRQSLFFHFDYARTTGHIFRDHFVAEDHRIHRIQLWNFSKGDIPVISDGDVNIVVSESKIHNDASVDISADGHLLVALLPPPRTTVNPYMPTPPPGQTVGVYSLVWESLGQLLYTTSLDRPAVSVALSPTATYLLVGLATRRSILLPSEHHNAIAQAFRLEGAKPGRPIGARGRLNLHRDIEAQNAPLGINCIRWAPVSGHGMVYGTNTGALVMLH